MVLTEGGRTVHPPPPPRRVSGFRRSARKWSLCDVPRDPREVLGRLGHRRAVVEPAPDACVLDVLDELAEMVYVRVVPVTVLVSVSSSHFVPKCSWSDFVTPGGEAGVPRRVLRVVAGDERQPGRWASWRVAVVSARWIAWLGRQNM